MSGSREAEAKAPTATSSRSSAPAPWSFRLFDAVPVAPIWVGLSIAVVLGGAWTAATYESGLLQRVLSGEVPSITFRATFTGAILIGYVPTAHYYLARWTRFHLEELRPLLRPSARPAFDLSPSRTAGLLGLLSFTAFFILPVMLREPGLPGSIEEVIPWIVVPALGWLTFRLGDWLVRSSVRFSSLAMEIERIDLFDTRPLGPFVRQGLRGSLIVVLFLSLSANLYLTPVEEVIVGSTFNVVAWGVVAIVALILPVRGVRGRIRDEKRAQLTRLQSRLNADRAAILEGSPESDRVAARLPGLLALETRLVAVHEWPFDVSSVVRMSFYLMIGLGSWLGAAAVERILDVALG
jgi:hypothetical protein